MELPVAGTEEAIAVVKLLRRLLYLRTRYGSLSNILDHSLTERQFLSD